LTPIGSPLAYATGSASVSVFNSSGGSSSGLSWSADEFCESLRQLRGGTDPLTVLLNARLQQIQNTEHCIGVDRRAVQQTHRLGAGVLGVHRRQDETTDGVVVTISHVPITQLSRLIL